MKYLAVIALLFGAFSVFSQDPVPCEEPYPQVQNLFVAYGDSTVNLNWTPIIGSQGCRIRLSQVLSSEISYRTIDGEDLSSYSIPGDDLVFQQQYEVQVSCGCSEEPLIVGNYSNSAFFFSGSTGQIVPCEEPYPAVSNLVAIPTQELDGIKLSWSPIPMSKGCQIEYKTFLGPLEGVQVIGFELDEYVLPESQLVMNNGYSWRVRCGCSFSPRVVGSWSNQGFFNSGEVGTLEGFLPKAKFTAVPQAPTTGTEVKFTDRSLSGAISWIWDFGDGTTSTEQDPVHTYLNEGTYTVSLAVTNAFGADTLTRVSFVNVFEPSCPSSVSDMDGNEYSVVQIGNFCWTGENLRAVHFNNGDEIPNLPATLDWQAATGPAYCNYNNDVALGDSTGRLYNGYVVLDDRNVCPSGWHAPLESEWIAFEELIGMPAQDLNVVAGNRGDGRNIGGQLKADVFWSPFNIGGMDTYGLKILPMGYRFFVFIDFTGLQNGARFHVENDLSDSPELYHRGFGYLWKGIQRLEGQMIDGNSVRCVMD